MSAVTPKDVLPLGPLICICHLGSGYWPKARKTQKVKPKPSTRHSMRASDPARKLASPNRAAVRGKAHNPGLAVQGHEETMRTKTTRNCS
eukprot:4775197-Pyramimonas_sp.AAC.1